MYYGSQEFFFLYLRRTAGFRCAACSYNSLRDLSADFFLGGLRDVDGLAAVLDNVEAADLVASLDVVVATLDRGRFTGVEGSCSDEDGSVVVEVPGSWRRARFRLPWKKGEFEFREESNLFSFSTTECILPRRIICLEAATGWK